MDELEKHLEMAYYGIKYTEGRNVISSAINIVENESYVNLDHVVRFMNDIKLEFEEMSSEVKLELYGLLTAALERFETGEYVSGEKNKSLIEYFLHGNAGELSGAICRMEKIGPVDVWMRRAYEHRMKGAESHPDENHAGKSFLFFLAAKSAQAMATYENKFEVRGDGFASYVGWVEKECEAYLLSAECAVEREHRIKGLYLAGNCSYRLALKTMERKHEEIAVDCYLKYILERKDDMGSLNHRQKETISNVKVRVAELIEREVEVAPPAYIFCHY